MTGVYLRGNNTFSEREGHRQPDEHWNCSKADVAETSERQGGAHMGFSERIDTEHIFLNLYRNASCLSTCATFKRFNTVYPKDYISFYFCCFSNDFHSLFQPRCDYIIISEALKTI